jgi:hypothetical protein
MATPKVLHLRSQVKGKLPAAGAIQVGQIGVNYNSADPFICIKDSAGNVRRLDGASVGTVAPAGAITGQLWVDNTGTSPVLKVYTGTIWSPVDTVPVAATTAVAGVVQLATATDVTNGAVDRVVTANLLKTSVAGATYTLPVATTGTLGGVKVGTNLAAAADGTLTVRAATNAVDGSIRVATDAEATAGTLETVAVNPKQLKGIGLPAVTTAGDVLTLESVGGATPTAAWKAPAATYTLPVATAAQLGGIKAGTGVTVAGDGTLSVSLTGGLTYKGQTDPTATAPAGPVNGDVWIASAGGAYHASWSLTGTATAGELLIYEGSKWDAVGQASAPVKSDWAAGVGAAGEILNKPGDATTSVAGLMSAADKTKLDGVAAGAQVNVKPDWNAAAGNAAEILNKPTIPAAAVDATDTTKGIVQLANATAITNGTAGLVVDAAQLKVVSDAVTAAAGGGITTITPTAPITATGTGTSRTIGIVAATNLVAGSMSATDKAKLDGITAGAEPNVQPDWNEADNTQDSFIRNKPTIPAAYTLPAATTSALGGVSVGTGLAVNAAGVLTNAYSYTLPAAAAGTLGGVKVGNGLAVTADGTLSVSSSGALTFKGAKLPSDTAPAGAAKGDTYVMSAAGQLHSSWTPLGSTPVSLHEVIAYDGTEWVLLGSAASTAVTAITASAPLSATGTSTVALTVADASNTIKGVIRIATDAEATGGTLTSACVTPAQLKARIPDGTKVDQYLRWDQTATAWVAADSIEGGTY